MTNMADRKDLSKSAPANGRRPSNSEQKKNSTIKDINSWISKENSDPIKRNTARHVSQLTENVTEQRMLYARQLELGRERYKFLVSHEYEKQKFVERQTGKEKMMKKYMASARKIIDKAYTDKPKKTLTIRIPQVEYLSQSSTPVNEDQAERLDSRASKASTKSLKKPEPPSTGMPKIEPRAGSKLAVKPDTERSQKGSKVSVIQPQRTPKEITFVDYSRPESRAISKESNEALKTPNMCNDTEEGIGNGGGVYLNTSWNFNESSEYHGENTNKLPSVVNPCTRRNFNQERHVSGLSARSRSSTSIKTHTSRPVCDNITRALGHIPDTPKWTEKREFGSSITDPRYVALQNTLQPADLPLPTSAEIKDIIAKNYVLRTSGRCESTANAKLMHAKFIALLLEKELSCE